MQHSCLVAPEDKEEAKKGGHCCRQAVYGRTFQGIGTEGGGRETDEKKVPAGVDIDSGR